MVYGCLTARFPGGAREEKNTAMPSALHQITMSYAAEEDRLLLRISTADKTEYRLWLTRRFVGVLWSALMQTMEKSPVRRKAALMPAAQQAVMAMEHREALEASDFSHRHDQKGFRNLTSKSGPLLVVGGSVTPGKDGSAGLVFKTLNKAEIKCTLNKNLLHALCKLLTQTTAKAGWDLGFTVGDPGIVAPADKTRVH